MQGKFDGVPIEEGTIIIFQLEAAFGKYKVLYQKWKWEGVTAESVIFDNQDIVTMSDDEIIMEVKNSPLLNPDAELTFKRSESGFTFVNFNFVSE